MLFLGHWISKGVTQMDQEKIRSVYFVSVGKMGATAFASVNLYKCVYNINLATTIMNYLAQMHT